MYLKSIKLDGFKSFAEKTVFEFNKGITAIVGPNGSGKSNIVDAVRWVLGEQSVKSLRGGSLMSDVIFSGSEFKNALNKAAVTLTFDNHDHFLNSEFSEIEVKRVVYRNGENEYYLNNNHVRLKDITDLFIDSKTSSDSFNIISQGNITDIINSKPLERRTIFESAAGVLKYKKRKEESLKKLDKSQDNLNSINLVIEELKTSLLPLESESKIATKYLELKDNLKNTEIALITSDINTYNIEYENLKKKEEELNSKLEKINFKTNDDKCEKLKLDIYKKDDEIALLNQKILKITEELSLFNSEKRIAIERAKYEYSDDKVQNNLINLKEEELNTIKEIDLLNNEIDNLNKEIKDTENLNNNTTFDYNNITLKRNSYNNELEDDLKEKYQLENKINLLENNILNNETMPLSVKNIINNNRLMGIHNTLGNILDIPNNYSVATSVILASGINFIVVDDEIAAKEAINYLKEKNLGRATFLPLNIIKSRLIDSGTINRVASISGYVGILSQLVKYDHKYQNIIENQLGNVIVASDIDSMNNIAKILEYKYRIVSLDGSVIYAGGSISGGGNKKNNIISFKLELEENNNKLKNVNTKIETLNEEIKNLDNDYELINGKLTKIKEKLIELDTIKKNKLNTLNNLEEKLKIIKNDIEGANTLKNNSIDSKLEDIMNKVNLLEIDKEKLEQEMATLKDDKDKLNSDLELLEKERARINSEYRVNASELNDISGNIGKLNAKLDNLLLTLNEEYNMTYEFAQENYALDIEIDIARNMVQKLKHEIRSLGEVNIGSIKEYERLSTRYNFLMKQKEDLESSITGLLDIISDMDNIMIDKFKNTFNKIKEEFSKVFKIMFQGGNGSLELTDPNDYLNTGIEMIVIPPGKKLNNTQSLSGGEKSLTAICLLFAILNVSPVPFIILDEVEAALDEANVDLFGEYLNKKKNDSQYILITHKKRMMEYADVLYGITMQNAGISKVVGVELQNI